MKKILIVEDELSLLKVLKLHFRKIALVDVALDAAEALEKLEKDKPNLILLDILLPKIDGFVLLKKIKKADALKTIPVIIFSNLSQDSDIEKGLSLGALEYIDKSKVTIQELVKKIQRYLEN